MTKKRRVTAEVEPMITGAAAPARKRKHTAAKHAVAAPAAFAEPTPKFEEIATLAYSYWESRGCQGGSPEEDWFRAEQALRQDQQASAASA